MTTEQILIISLYLIFIVSPFVLRKYTRVISSDGEDSFATGKKNYGWAWLTAGLSATFIGGAAVLNLGSLGYQFGWYALADVLPTSLALFFVAFVLLKRIKNNKMQTLGQLIGYEPRIKLISGLLSTITYTLITAAQVIALATLLSPYFGVRFEILALITTITIGFYISFGGYKSVTITDIIQFVLMILFYLLFVGVSIMFQEKETLAQVAEFGKMPTDIIVLLALTFLFVPSSQDLHIRVQSAKNFNSAKTASILSGIFYLLFGCLSIYIGIHANEIGLKIDNPDDIVPHFLSETFGSLAIIPILAVIAIVVSTLDSVLFVATTSFTYDFLGGIKKEQSNFNKESKFVTFVILGIALVIALYFPSILSLILSALVLYVSILFPLIIARSAKLYNRRSFYISLILLIGFTVFEFLKIDLPYRYIYFTVFHLLALFINHLVMPKNNE